MDSSWTHCRLHHWLSLPISQLHTQVGWNAHNIDIRWDFAIDLSRAWRASSQHCMWELMGLKCRLGSEWAIRRAIKGGSGEGWGRMEIEFGDNQKFISWLKLVLLVYFNVKIHVCSNLTRITILLTIVVLLPWILLNYFQKKGLLGNVVKQ